MNDKALVFISCGQFSDEERKLGEAVAALVDATPGHESYFAQNQQSLDGLTKSVFGALDRAAAVIAIMHPRGEVETASGRHTRASVWVEQEIAIAAFLQTARGEQVEVASYTHAGIRREGVRETIILNPREFTSSDEVLMDLAKKLAIWNLQPKRSKEARVDVSLGYESTKVEDQIHLYDTKIVMTNVSEAIIKSYTAELTFPKWFIMPYAKILTEDREQATATHRIFRHENFEGKPLLPGYTRRILNLGYQVTDDLYDRYGHGPEFSELVTARVFGEGGARTERSIPFRELQKF